MGKPYLVGLSDVQVDLLLSMFVAYCHKVKHLVHGTISGKLSAIRYYHLQDTGRILSPHPLTAQAMAAVAKQCKAVQHRDAVFLQDIMIFWPTAAAAGGIVLTAWRGVLLAFFLLLRASEFLGDDKRRAPTHFCLRCEGVHFFGEGSAEPLPRHLWRTAAHARLRLPGSKTDQRLIGTTLVVAATGGSAADPVCVLADLLLSLPSTLLGTAPIMTVFRAGAQSMVTRAEVTELVQAMVVAAGRDIDNVGIHAMRVGGATTLAAAGMSERAIKLAGRWRSEAYKVYIRDNMADFTAITAALAGELSVATVTVAKGVR